MILRRSSAEDLYEDTHTSTWGTEERFGQVEVVLRDLLECRFRRSVNERLFSSRFLGRRVSNQESFDKSSKAVTSDTDLFGEGAAISNFRRGC